MVADKINTHRSRCWYVACPMRWRRIRSLFLFFFVGLLVSLTRGKLLRNSGYRPQNRISSWERAFCQLESLELSPTELREQCETTFYDSGAESSDELACLSFLASRSLKETKPCTSADFTDALANIPLLLKLRNRQKREWSNCPLLFHMWCEKVLKFKRSGVLVSTCVKDETRMLLFSMVWHLLLGVDHYFICDHSSENSSLDRALKPFVGTGMVTIKKYYGHGEIQQRCFDDALRYASSNGYKWQGGLDTDEFTVLSDRFSSLEGALDHFADVSLGRDRKVGAVGLNWISQPPYNQTSIYYPEDLYITPAEKSNFVLRSSDKNRHVKSFGLTKEILSWSHVHMPREFREITTVTVNTAGEPLLSVGSMFETEPVVSDAAVVHFTHRTMQELAAKRERGRATLDCESVESIGDQNCAVVHSARRSKRKISELAEQYLQLLANPGETHYDSEDENDERNFQSLQNCYRRLAGQVKQVLSRAP